jgi:hypothetical protein
MKFIKRTDLGVTKIFAEEPDGSLSIVASISGDHTYAMMSYITAGIAANVHKPVLFDADHNQYLVGDIGQMVP